jgi:hypothetical protein
MKIKLSKSQWEFIGKQCGWIKISQEDYRGQHTAPTKEDAPLYDVTQLYPEDIYSSNATQLYRSGSPYDNESIYIIQSCRNRPNKLVKIYRAIPNVNSEIEQEVKGIHKLIEYVYKYGFLPMSDNNKYKDIPILHEINDVYRDKKEILEILYKKQNELNSKKEPNIKINPGDWVTINLHYAKEHGQSNLNNDYKIISKTVKASELFTDANSIHEWGYNP